MRGALRGALASAIFGLNTLFWCSVLYVAAFVRWVVPLPAWRRLLARVLMWIGECWIWGNSAGLALTQPTVWDVEIPPGLKRDGWYLVVCNHRSWVDIVVLQKVFLRRLPFLKFFLKDKLIWVPVLGLAWRILEFPFMKRYPREVLEKSPELRRKDLESTLEACERFKSAPVSVVNYVEGTRFTRAKHDRQGSPYRHLLLPRAGGLAYACSALGDRLSSIIDVTIAYPDGRYEFWDLVSGRVPRIVVRMRERPIPEEWKRGDYLGDEAFRERFQAGLRAIWDEKDALLTSLLEAPRQLSGLAARDGASSAGGV